MKLLNIETSVTRNFIPQILLNVQDFTSIRLATQVMTKVSSDLRHFTFDVQSMNVAWKALPKFKTVGRSNVLGTCLQPFKAER
jgi:hypothetical protein